MSAAMRTVVSGVRSSWDTSEVNWRCKLPYSCSWWICLENDSAIELKLMARRAISSSPSTTIRSLRWPEANRSAMRLAERTGMVTCCVRSHMMPTSRTTSTTPPNAAIPRMSASVDSSAVSGMMR